MFSAEIRFMISSTPSTV